MPNPSELTPPTREAHEKALEVARTSPALHVPRHVRKEQIHAQVHGSGPIGRANAWVAVRITKIVGTMYCAYIFTIIAVVALPSAIQQGSPTVLVNWVSSNFLQLVLLPIIIVGQNVISAAQDARAEADHETLTALNQMNIQQLEILKTQQEILELLKGKAS
ncbi:MAG TPA: hypothetical protein VKT82_08560 [Ktedonobacterales bacterium]|nr:hypothetical protein [Ktedonobacterales bacterium]